MNDHRITERIHAVLGVPRTDTGKHLARCFTPMSVTSPQIGTCLVWKELYRANAYPSSYYAAATFRSIEL